MQRPTTADAPEFSLSETRRIIGDLFRPNRAVYWTDFLVTISLSYVSFFLVRAMPDLLPSPRWATLSLQLSAFVVSCLAIYRAVMFIHELVHLRSTQLPGFRVAWNLLCGIPFLTPSSMYYSHVDHHRRSHYGTQKDGEYLPLVHRPRRFMVYYLAEIFIAPVLVVIRFLVLVPLGWCIPPLRRLVDQRATSLVIDPTYVRSTKLTAEQRRVLRLQEALCFVWCVAIIVAARVVHDRWPIPLVVQAYATSVCILWINAVRTLGSHHYAGDGREMTFVEQLLDSVNYHQRPWLAELWGPVGTRYHALHHLFPSLPFHALPEAHRRLVNELPPDSPYHRTEGTSLLGSVWHLWHNASKRHRIGPERVGVGAATDDARRVGPGA